MTVVKAGSEWTVREMFSSNIVGLSNGAFLALWAELEEGPSRQIRGQIFDADSTSLTGPFVLEAATSGSVGDPVAAPLSNGRFAVAWHHNTDGLGTYELQTVIVDATGTPEGSGTTIDNAKDPVITSLPNGGHAIAHKESGENKLTVFSPDGVLSETGYTSSGSFQAITALGNGSILRVVGAHSTEDGTTLTAYLRQPEKPSTPIPIADLDGSGDKVEVITLANGNAVIVWRDGAALNARILTSQGETLGGEITLYDAAAALLGGWTVEALPEGGFALAFLRDGGQTNVCLGVYSAIGDMVEAPSVVGHGANGSPPSIAILKDGRYVVSWREQYGGPVHFQAYDPRTKGVTVSGDDVSDRYTGTGFDDVLNGGDGADRLVGEGGNDALDGGLGGDLMFGGAGDDTYYVNSDADRIVEWENAGLDRVITWVSQDLWDEVENLIATGAADITLNGNSLSNAITGNASRNILNGKAGDDVLNGGAGADQMIGGAGNDTFIVDDEGDRASEEKGGGRDMISTSVSFTLASDNDIEELAATGGAGVALKGNALANTITGNTGSNKLWGGGGSDVLKGDAGRDIFVFDVRANKKSNFDRIADFNVKDDMIWLDNKVFAKLGRKGTETKPEKLSKDAFVVDSKAKDKNDHLVYDKKKGVLYYDADGSGHGKAVEIATLKKNLKMTAADFFVI